VYDVIVVYAVSALVGRCLKYSRLRLQSGWRQLHCLTGVKHLIQAAVINQRRTTTLRGVIILILSASTTERDAPGPTAPTTATYASPRHYVSATCLSGF